MSDWEIYSSDIGDNKKSSAQTSSDWETLSASETKPSFGQALAEAPGKIGQDIYEGITNFAGKIPKYYESAKTEVPGLFGITGGVRQHPLHALSQGLAGTQEAINMLAQAPLSLAQYGSNRLNLLPESVTNAISKITPEDTSSAINQIFGEPKYQGETLLRGTARNIPQIAGGAKLISALKPSGLLATKKSIKNTILNTHDTLENKATNTFKDVSNQVNLRKINQIPTNLTNNIDFQGIRSYFPATKKYEKILTGAEFGDYNSLRKLQSDLYSEGKKNLGSDLAADRMKGAEMLERRDEINSAIQNHLEKTGNSDLSAKLQSARNDWRTLQNIYYNENMNNAIVNMVNKDYRKIPKNLVEVLGEESNPMQALKDFHDGLENALKKYQTRGNVFSTMRKIVIPAAIGAAGGYGAYHYGSSPK